MKRFTKTFAMLLFLCCMTFSFARAQSLWTYDENMGLILHATDGEDDCQFSSDFPADGQDGRASEGSYANMIDGDLGTFFTTNWSEVSIADDSHPHWLQVDLQDRPQTKIIFRYGIRNDEYGQSNRPTTMQVYASNDATNWRLVKEYADGDLPKLFDVKYFTSGMIDLGESSRYLRFAVPTTVGAGAIGNYPYFAIGEFQVYEAVETKDPLQILTLRFNEVKDNMGIFAAGEIPGYYPTALVDALISVVDRTEILLSSDPSADQCTNMLAELNKAYDDIANAMIPLNDGYYYIHSELSTFKEMQPDVIKAMYASFNSRLYWGNLDTEQAKFVFKVTKLPSGNYTIQNLATKEYLRCIADASFNYTDATDTQMSLSKEADPTYEQTISALDGGGFNIGNIVNTRAYNTQLSANGTGIGNIICSWTSGAGGEAAWSFYPVSSEDLARLEGVSEKQYMAEKLSGAVSDANKARVKANDYTALITDATQISSNKQSTGDGSAYANLIDGNTGTIFHSVWDATYGMVQNEGDGWHNLQFDLGNAVNKIYFTFVGRDNTDGWHDNPTHITLYGTNDADLAANTAAADSTQWSEIVDMTKEAYGFPGNDNLVSYESPVINFNEAYRFLRFVVKHVSTQDGGNRATSFMSPELTGVTFNLSEMQIYDANPAASSEYNTVAGMKEACDALDKLIAEASEKIANLTATQADIDALQQATEAVNNLYVERSVFDAELAELLAQANEVYVNIKGDDIKLITDAEAQCSSNAQSTGDASSFAHLIDGDPHYSYNFHTVWSDKMKDADITEDEWADFLKDYYGGVEVGSGYHNLQVKLNEPVSTFWFNYIGRCGTTYHDSPNDIEIYATNDDELGASTNQADISSWTRITELTEGFPDDIDGAEYTSPLIQLGDTYKYIRFVVKKTTHMNTVDARTFNAPDVTGVTWNVGEFQMYNSLNAERSQYHYVPGMKEAVDALKELIDADSKLGKNQMINSSVNDALRQALEKVMSLYADSTELVAIYNECVEEINNSVVGEGIGFVDSQAAIDEFQAAIVNARKQVNPLQPTAETIKTAVEQIKAAREAFMTHVKNITPNTWYTIVSGSTRAVFTDQPIFLGDTSVGDNLHIGGYPVDETDPAADPYAIWRFVPIEGQPGQYAIQSLGTGQYFGPYRGQGASNAPLMTHEKTPYILRYYGNGTFKIQQAGVEDPMDCLKTDKSNGIVLNYPLNNDLQQTFKFVPVSGDMGISFNWYPDNSIQVLTMPFANKGEFSVMNLNEGVKTYVVKALTQTDEGSRLELKLKNDFEAGEPMILVVNDYTQYDPSAPSYHVMFALPDDVVDESTIVNNGLVGTLTSYTVNRSGLGFFNASNLVTANVGGVIAGRYGYIDPKLVTNDTTGEPDLVIETTSILNGVSTVAVSAPSDKVDVYTIDGRLVKRQVPADKALKNLPQGIYVTGKQKIAVK